MTKVKSIVPTLVEAAVVLTLVLALAIVVAATAFGADFSAPITQLDGRPFTDAEGKETKITLGTVAETALLSVYPDEQNLDGVEKNKRFWLARRINESVRAGKDVALSAEETAMLKRLIAKAYNPLIMGQAWLILDPASAPR